MKKIIDFLNAPLFNLVFGFCAYLFVAFLVYSYRSGFDLPSALLGAAFFVCFSIFDYGFLGYLRLLRQKREQDPAE